MPERVCGHWAIIFSKHSLARLDGADLALDIAAPSVRREQWIHMDGYSPQARLDLIAKV